MRESGHPVGGSNPGFGGCSSMSATTAAADVGRGAIGASGGALIGWAAGSPAAGAAIGGGAGLLGGYLYDQYEKYQRPPIPPVSRSPGSPAGRGRLDDSAGRSTTVPPAGPDRAG